MGHTQQNAHAYARAARELNGKKTEKPNGIKGKDVTHPFMKQLAYLITSMPYSI